MSGGLSLPLPDGRALEVLSAGPEDGTVLIFHHGSPGAAVGYEPYIRACADRHLRLVTYSRPGFGDSSRDEGRTVASCAGDTAAIADALGAERFLTVGWSGGGAHALACAALLPERVLACATLAGVAPWDAVGLDWTSGMGEDNRIEYPTAARDPQELLRWMEPRARAMATIQPDHIVQTLRSLISEVDEVHVTGGFAEMLAELFHRAFANGLWGWFDDDLAFTRPWGVDLGSIRVPVSIWQGAQDLMVPSAHGEWLAANVRGARAELRAEHGHLSLVDAFGDILDGLLARARS